MNLYPFYSFPISKEELKELKEKLNSLDLETLNEKNINLCRTKQISINLAHIENDLFTVGIIDQVNNWPEFRATIDKVLKENPDIQEKFETALGDSFIKEDKN